MKKKKRLVKLDKTIPKTIYFVQCQKTKYIKVGMAKKFKDRFHNLKVDNAGILKELFIFQGDQTIEERLHKLFKEYHLHGEWFRPGERLLKFIKNPGLEEYDAIYDDSNV